jgi:hypothetical protein
MASAARDNNSLATSDNMGNADVSQTFAQEELNGQRLALKGRIYTLIRGCSEFRVTGIV